MSKKKKKEKKKFVSLQTHHVKMGTVFCGFPLNTKKVNQVWHWVTLDDCKF